MSTPERSPEVRLPPRAETFFRRFTSQANYSTLHEVDRQRFYQFVIVCHQTRVRTSQKDIRRLLTEAGFEPLATSSLARIYFHGRRLLKAIPHALAQMRRDRTHTRRHQS